MTEIPRPCARPCKSCPWRRDTEGRWGYDNLVEYAAGTIPRTAEFEAAGGFGILFACHAAGDDPSYLCAGWLAVVGADHPAVRLGVALKLIPTEALRAGPDWPELYSSYEEMAAAQGGETNER